MEDKTTIDIYVKDKKTLEDLKYYIRMEFGKVIYNVQLLEIIIGFLKEKEKEFKEYLKKKLNS